MVQWYVDFLPIVAGTRKAQVGPMPHRTIRAVLVAAVATLAASGCHATGQASLTVQAPRALARLTQVAEAVAHHHHRHRGGPLARLRRLVGGLDDRPQHRVEPAAPEAPPPTMFLTIEAAGPDVDIELMPAPGAERCVDGAR